MSCEIIFARNSCSLLDFFFTFLGYEKGWDVCVNNKKYTSIKIYSNHNVNVRKKLSVLLI